MRRWPRPLRLIQLQAGSLIRFPCSLRLRQYATQQPRRPDTNDEKPISRPTYRTSGRHRLPNGKAAASLEEWASLLEPALPLHLRVDNRAGIDDALNGRAVSEILLAAQNLKSGAIEHDLLHHLGIEKHRWQAVVFLVKLVIDTFPPYQPKVSASSPWTWSHPSSFKSLTEAPIRNVIFHRSDPSGDINQPLLIGAEPSSHASTAVTSGTDHIDEHNLTRDALGQIWISLGNMIVSSVDLDQPVVQPEILEMVAYLHHHGWMPASIYNYTSNSDPTVMQQSPILNLCSKRILTSLSDAAWKGHERVLVTQAASKGKDPTDVHPELGGSAYRVNVAGLRPEVWLELILWASLHGGWTEEGLHVLRVMMSERQGWKALSWRALELSKQANSNDWERLAYSFTTDAIDQMQPSDLNVHKTVSSELVNAYVDALIGSFSSNSRQDNGTIERAMSKLILFHRFLSRSGLLLSAGSWDAVILRFLEHADNHIMNSSFFSTRLLSLASNFGGELESKNAQTLPSYVLDGSAATLGNFHRALQSQISAGNLQGALAVLRGLQDYTDANKRISVSMFFQQIAKNRQAAQPDDAQLFTSPYSGITFPAYDPQIPVATLAELLNLITDYKAFDLGRWMLYNDAVDGPLIPSDLYQHAEFAPALIRFAVESDDHQLLATSAQVHRNQDNVSSSTNALPVETFQSYLETQVSLKRWDAAISLLQYLQSTAQVDWSLAGLAAVTRIMLREYKDAGERKGQASPDLVRSRQIFADMVTGKYNVQQDRHARPAVRLLLVMLSNLDPHWGELIASHPEINMKSYIPMSPAIRFFNSTLESVALCYGSNAGRQLVDLFWSQTVREAQQHEKMGRPVDLLDTIERQRLELPLLGSSQETVAVLGGLTPNVRTIIIILAQAAKELEASMTPNPEAFRGPAAPRTSTSTKETSDYRGTILWCMQALKELGMTNSEVGQDLQTRLSDQALTYIYTPIGTPESADESPIDQTDRNFTDGGDESTG